MNKTILMFIIGAVTATGFIATDRYFSETTPDAQKSELTGIPMALADPSACTMSIDNAMARANFDFKMPKSLPAKYVVQDAYGEEGQITLYYASGPICGDGPNRSYEDGIIKYHTANAKSVESEIIAKGAVYFSEYKEQAPIPEKVKLFEINGIPAMGWESGTRKSFVIDTDGTIIHEEDIPHPAQIRVVDPQKQVAFSLTANLPLDQLKMIMSDTLQ